MMFYQYVKNDYMRVWRLERRRRARVRCVAVALLLACIAGAWWLVW